jgi:hypothetical protein
MKRTTLIIFLCGVMVLGLTGCSNNLESEEFKISYTLEDGRLINFAYDPEYNDTTISDAISKGVLISQNFISSLEYLDSLKDGGSKIYKYDSKTNNGYGNLDFYVIECNSLDGIKDIYVAKYKNNLIDKCTKSD